MVALRQPQVGLWLIGSSFLLAHCILVLAVPGLPIDQSLAARCVSTPKSFIMSDPERGTRIFSWTKSEDYLLDSHRALIANANIAANGKKNLEIFCPNFAAVLSASPSDKIRLEKALASDLAKDLMCGHGLYFTNNPFISTDFGDILLVVTFPVGKLVPFYSGSNAMESASNIFSPHGVVGYRWGIHRAVVVRDYHELECQDGSIEFEAIDFRFIETPREFRHHSAYDFRSEFNWKGFMLAYKDWIKRFDSLSQLEVTWNEEGRLFLDEIAVATLIGMEWMNGCEKSRKAIDKFGSSNIDIPYVVDRIIMGYYTWPGEWSGFISLLLESEYLTPQQALNLREGDYAEVIERVKANFLSHETLAVVSNLLKGIKMLEAMEPSLRIWKEHVEPG